MNYLVGMYVKDIKVTSALISIVALSVDPAVSFVDPSSLHRVHHSSSKTRGSGRS